MHRPGSALVAQVLRWLAMLLCVAASPAMAWGDAGHKIIALVANEHLSPQVRQKVKALLAQDTTDLAPTDIANQATWADKWRDSDRFTGRSRYLQTREWHYVNIQLADAKLAQACHGHPALPASTWASDGPARACIVDKIDQFTKELRDPRTPPDQRRLAMQFLLHFIGDLHQPLHAADDRDRGGNDKKVWLPGFDPNNLHQFWDTTLVRRLGARPATVARNLSRAITPKQRREWSGGEAADWARESFVVARTHTYAGLPPPDAEGRRALTPAYVKDATGIARTQLSKAGVRLAWVLNGALR